MHLLRQFKGLVMQKETVKRTLEFETPVRACVASFPSDIKPRLHRLVERLYISVG